MVMLTISSSDELMARLETLAEHQGVTVEALVTQLIEDYVATHRPRREDPIVGLFDSGQDDIVERHEDILRGWQPD